jgi:lysyl-tRNA synthetase class 2
MPDEHRLIQERKRKLRELEEAGINPYPYSFEHSDYARDILSKHAKLKPGTKTKDTVKVAGRIMTMRRMGKATFCHIQDSTGKIQLYFNHDELGRESYRLLKKVELGDIIGVDGHVFTTKTGEVTVFGKSYAVLCKTVRPLPEKFHGLRDAELRHRKSYLDLIMNPEEKEKYRRRALVIHLLREYLDNLGFLEVDTPVLQPLYGGTNAKPFITHINALDMRMYLRIAPELYLKRLLIGGFERVYEISRNFRNEGVDSMHNPEFSMVEWYEAYADYNLMMDRAEDMIRQIAKKLNSREELTIRGKRLDLSKKWPRVPLKQAIKKHLKIDVDKHSEAELKKVCAKNDIELKGEMSKGIITFMIFDKLVAGKLHKPTWIVDYPKDVSPLAKQHRKDDSLVERFELYIAGLEIADGWSELVSPIEQRKRFEHEQRAMRAGDEEAHPMDNDFIEAMEHGMPPSGGIGLGIDRLVMLFTDQQSIRDVLLFPMLRPQ